MIKTNDKGKCCGCKTCSLVCPKNCISFRKDEIGSLYPSVNIEECIHCDQCEKVCPIQRSFDKKIGQKAYVAYSDDSEVRYRGSSGGMFETIAEWIIGKNGSVFASRFDSNLQLKCFEATNMTEVRRLTKSKYLQSDCVEAFPIIKKRVDSGVYVLFCSSPCQISALKSYLGPMASNDNLFLLDFFCHGVPSQGLFDKCIYYLEKKNRIRVTGYEFRSKIRNGATPHYYTIKYQKNNKELQKTELYLKDPFYLGFQKYLTLRDSCYYCPYGYGHHYADITVGDFHNIERYIKGINRFDGVSTVLINTTKGHAIWNEISHSLVAHDIEIERLYNDKEIFSGPTKMPASRAEFINDMGGMDFQDVVEKWLNSKVEWKKEVYYHMPTVLRNMIKRIAEL